MKLFVKIVLVVCVSWFLCSKFLDYTDHSRLKNKNPFIHRGCMLAFYDKMNGKPCQICMERYEKITSEKTKALIKKWEKVRGKPFDSNDLNQSFEMLQILMNHKVCDYLEE